MIPLQPRTHEPPEKVKTPSPPPPPALDTASWWKKLFFIWVNPLLSLQTTISDADLNALQLQDQAEYLSLALLKAWQHQVKRQGSNSTPNITWLLCKVFRGPLFLSGLIAFLEIGTRVGEALCLGGLIRHFQGHDGSHANNGYLWAVGLCLNSALHGILHHHLFFIGMRFAVQVRTALIALMYRKAACLSTLQQTSSGAIVSLISTEVAVYEPLCIFGHFLWTAVIELIVCTGLLWDMLSWPCFLGLAVMLLMVPFQGMISRWFGQVRRSTVQWRDARVQLMTDLIQGMAVVKYNAWRAPFIRAVGQLRDKEMKALFRAGGLDAFNMATFTIFPLLISLVVFGTCHLLGRDLDAATVFSSLALYNLLRLTLTVFIPKVVRSWSESLVASKRIVEFLQLPDNGQFVGSDPTVLEEEDGKDAMACLDGTFQWTGTTFTLKVQHAFQANRLYAVAGPVGSGKSSLLSALLGEMPVVVGGRRVPTQPIGYAPQSAWIQAGSIVENITFGLPMDAAWLRDVVSMCALDRDVELWSAGLDTIVGERGMSLSGGQKARIGLARVIYARPKILLLDDPLAAVDTRVARHIFSNLRSHPALQTTSRILVTHQLNFARECDEILMMDHGRVVLAGSWDEILTTAAATPSNTSADSSWLQFLLDFEQVDEPQTKSDEKETHSTVVAIAPQSDQVFIEDSEVIGIEDAGEAREADTGKATGKDTMGWKTYYRFIVQPNPTWALTLALFLCFGGQIVSVFADQWLARWAGLSGSLQHGSEGIHYMTLFASFVSVSAVVSVIRAVACYFLLLHSSSVVSKEMLCTVLDATMAWFAGQPTGRILNRFAKDQSLVDEVLPNLFFDFVQCLVIAASVFVLVMVILPWVAVSVPLILGLFLVLRRWYIGASRQIKRIESATRSPVYAHLNETLDGLAVIRALHAQDQFLWRFMGLQDTNTRAVFAQNACARWLGLRLDLLSAVFLLIASMVAVVISRTGTLSPALAGFALSYTLTLNGLLQWMVRQSAEVEVMFVSVERMLEYCDVVGEAAHPSQTLPPSSGWPSQGHVRLSNLSLTYPTSSSPALRGWTEQFHPGERIGIVGRSGSGKSTFFAALFRMYDFEGSIQIDGVEISQLRAEALRDCLGALPQEPFLFRGTIRFNLDPFGKVSDQELWTALSRVELKDMVEGLPDKLDAQVEEGGSNLSLGQRQLLCLARALIKRTKVLVMDECSANIDLKTDELIQKVIQDEFRNTVVLTIAHRLATVINYDRILVVDAGQIVECAHAHELLQRPESLFARMVSQLGKDTERSLRDLARADWTARGTA